MDPISFTPVVLNRANENGVIGGGSNRNLISIDQAFDQAIEDGSSSDPITESKEKYMESQLGALDEKVREINLNYAEISEAITKASEEAHAKVRNKQHTHTHTTVKIILIYLCNSPLYLTIIVPLYTSSLSQNIFYHQPYTYLNK